MRVLVDADFLVALAKEDDTNHRSAISRTRILDDALVFVSPFTIPEAATVLSYKVSQKEAKKFYQKQERRVLSNFLWGKN